MEKNSNSTGAERRQRNRLRLRYPIQLRRQDQVINGETDDLSSEGFYCTLDQPLAPGEHLDCEILISPEGEHALVLNCRATVLRLEIKGLEPGFGIAFRFERQKVSAVSKLKAFARGVAE